jgi:hypothetical protein
MLKVDVFFFGSLLREPAFDSTLDYKDSQGVGVEIVVQHDVEATCTNF